MKREETSVTFSLPRDLAGRLPKGAAERREFLINAVEDRLALRSYASAFARIGGKVKSEKKAAAVRENGKKGGRPRKAEPTA